MKKHLLTVIILLGCSCLSDALISDNHVIAVVNSSTVISLDLIRLLRNDSNVFLSPLGISEVLTAVYFGTAGETRTKTAWALGYDYLTQEQIENAFTQLHSTILGESKNKMSIELSNAAFVDQEFKVKPSYTAVLNSTFDAVAKNVNFSNAEATKQEIDSWISDTSNNLIKSSDMNVSVTTKMLLLNALFFKEQWKTQFDSDRTRKVNFTNADSSQSECNLMTVIGTFNKGFSSELNAQVVELPYVNNNFSMFVFLPLVSSSIYKFMDDLSTPAMEEALKNLTATDHYTVSIPKFKVDFSGELNQPLKSLGFEDIFEPTANFRNVSNMSGLFLSDVFQQVSFEIDEGGSVAASAAAGSIVLGSAQNSIPTSFLANRPFFFAIQHKPTQAFVFCGKVIKADFSS